MRLRLCFSPRRMSPSQVVLIRGHKSFVVGMPAEAYAYSGEMQLNRCTWDMSHGSSRGRLVVVVAVAVQYLPTGLSRVRVTGRQLPTYSTSSGTYMYVVSYNRHAAISPGAAGRW